MVLFWSANYIVGKVALREFPPLLLSGAAHRPGGPVHAAGLLAAERAPAAQRSERTDLGCCLLWRLAASR